MRHIHIHFGDDLEKGKSQSAFQRNVRTEIAAGKPKKQALAIAYATQRSAKDEGCGCDDCATLDADEITAEDYEQLAQSLLDFIASKAGTSDAEWKEEDHPRAANGQFGQGGGGAAPKSEGGGLGEKPTSTTAKIAKHAVHELLSSGHPWTIEELAKITGHTNTKTLAAWLSMFKNEKTAGPKGKLNIIKLSDGRYQVVKEDGKPAPPVAVPKPEAPKEEPKQPEKKPEVVRAKNPVPAPTPTPPSGPKPAPGTVRWKPVEGKKAAAEAAKQAVANNMVSKADFGKLDASVINAHMQSLDDHLQEFPALRTRQDWAGSAQSYMKECIRVKQAANEEWVAKMWPKLRDEDPERFKQYVDKYTKRGLRGMKPGAKTWAFSTNAGHPGGSGISFNEAYGKAGGEKPGTFGNEKTGVAKLEQGLKHSVATGFHPPGCDTIKSIADHEYGHQLDNLLGLSKNPVVHRLYEDMMARRRQGEPAVSKYAVTNMGEFIAEAWAEAKNSPDPRYHAMQIATVIRRQYEAQFPKLPGSRQPATATA